MRARFLLIVAVFLAAQWPILPGPLLAQGQELWRAFNAMIKGVVRGYVLQDFYEANAHAESEENGDLADGLRRELRRGNLSPSLRLTYSILVWDRILPPDYQDLLHGYGVVEYDRCFSRQEPTDSRQYAPCGEGGATMTEISITESKAKVIMIFYTPEGSRAMLMHPSNTGVPGIFRRRSPLSGALTDAAETCSVYLQVVPFDAQSYANCLESETRSRELGHPMYSFLRGVVVVPAVPLTESYSAPGQACPRGFVLIDQLQWEPSLDDLTQHIRLMLVKIWLYVGTPVVIP